MNTAANLALHGLSAQDVLRESFLFRDLEGSQIVHLRRIIAKHPLRISAVYLVLTIAWTIATALGAMRTDTYTFALHFVPHASMFALIIGTIIYPLHLLWMPIGAYLLMFTAQATIPYFAPAGTPEDLLQLGPYWIGLLLTIVTGVTPGLICRALVQRLVQRMTSFSVDLVISLASGLIFTLFVVAQILLFRWIILANYPELVSVIGVDGPYIKAGLMRAALGGITVSGFLIGVLQYPSYRDLITAVMFATLFPVLALLGYYGLSLHKTMDMVCLGGIFAIMLPMRLVVPTIALGMVTYIAMTGALISGAPPDNPTEWVIQVYSIITLAIVVVILALRANGSHLLNQQTSSVRRLNTVRNYAGVGIFSVDVNTRLVSVDPVTQRMLGAPPQFDIATMMRKFGEREQRELRRLLFQRPGETTTLLARMREMPGVARSRVIRLFLWYEKTQENTPVVYGLVVDVTGEHIQERALKETLAELSIRQDQQKQMFSIISHELRTPASVISMLVDDLAEPAIEPSRIRQRLREATDQLLGVLTDMRQAVNPEKNLPVNLVALTPSDLAESIRNTFEMQARTAGVSIRLRLGDGANETVMGDSVRVKQIIGNLIRNAIIHSRCSTITLTYRSAPSTNLKERMGVWSVTDNGIGIAADQVDRLFQPFERGGDDARNRADGSGLGLYIVRTAAELLGGTVEFFPAPEGGAGYHIRMPEPLATPEQLAHEQNAEEIQIDFSQMHLLLAEDNSLVAEVTSARLRKHFASVNVVGSGREALDYIETNSPDIVITDLFMPEMPGDELTRILRSDGFDKPIIGLTAAVVGDDMRQFEMAGASCVMTKPLDEAALMRFLRQDAIARMPAATPSDSEAVAG